MTSLTGKTAVVTGSSSGIGRAIALELAAAGTDVVVHAGRNRAGADETAAAIESLGRQAHVLVCDLTDAAQHAQFVEQCFGWNRRVDIWINNAGADVLTGEASERSFEEKLALLWQVDVQATIALSRLAGQRLMQAGGGCLVNIGWDQAESGMAGDSGEMFAAVKGAVMAFTRSLAKSLAPHVRVNCVAPGWIRTSWGEQASDYWRERAVGESLLARWGAPEDVARAVRFLVGPQSTFITGQTINVNGGFRGHAP
ncbi:MAG: SDR family oxidoreductase [Pirellulaceae bacterium]